MNNRGSRGGGIEADIDRFLAVKRNRWMLLGGLGGLILCLFGVLLVLMIRTYYLPAATSVSSAPTSAPAVSVAGQTLAPQDSAATQLAEIEAKFTPTPACTEPWLVIGSARYPVQFISPAADGSLTLPPNPADGIAYTSLFATGQYVFLFAPTQAGLTVVQSAKPGEIITTGGTNCAEESFTLSAPEAVAGYSAALWNGQAEGAMILLQGAGDGQSILIRGEVVPAEIIATSTPNPQGPGVEAEVSLDDVSSTLLGKLRVKVSIYNYGASAVTLNMVDVSVTPAGGSPISPEDSSPNLPLTIQPGATESVTFTFAKPETPTATFKILTLEYDIEGY